MGAFYDDIPEYLVDWLRQQHMFWVATAPLYALHLLGATSGSLNLHWDCRSSSGHVNVSPKGVAGTFKVIDNRTVMYQVSWPVHISDYEAAIEAPLQDLTGSGSG